MAHVATLPIPAPTRRRGCPAWCCADHAEQRANGLTRFHVSPQVLTPTGWAYLSQDPGKDPVILFDIPTDRARETMSLHDATRTISALTELIGMTMVEGAK